ncbi:MAG: IS21-like element helper ATPase IstB [Polyangiaceae bacterium]
MGVIDELVPLLKKLKLSGVLHSLELRLCESVDDNLAYEEFLYRLLKDEVERREAKQLDQRLRRANFEHQKTLEDFDFHFNPEIPKSKVLDLATCTFVARRQNVLLLGQTGVGKSHIAQALGHRACRLGHSVLYVESNDLLRQLRAARADLSYDRKMARLTGVDLLIIDDLGLRQLSDPEPIDLYELVRLRYQKTSTIITSNRDTEELAELFGDALLASAAMDRLLHDAHVLSLVGETYRNPTRSKRARKSNNNQEATT